MNTCGITGCTSADTTYIGFSEWGTRGNYLCDRHMPTAEQAYRRGIVITQWTIHGCYPDEIAAILSRITGRTVRENTVRDDLRWLGLTEQHRAAEARLKTAVNLGEAGPNVVALRKHAR